MSNEVKLQPVRDVFFTQIFTQIQAGEDIVVVTSDLGAPSLDDLRKYYPERYISVGIAEQTLVSVAAGLCLAGKKVVAYGLNPFPITRAYDQVRTLLAEMKIPLTLCGLNAGLCSAAAGFSHMPIEDMGMMRMLANVKTVNPSDAAMSIKLAREVGSCLEPRYIRFDKAVHGTLYQEDEIDFRKGYTVYGQSAGCAIVSYGCFIPQLREIVDTLISLHKPVKLIDLFSLPADGPMLLEELRTSERIITVEENVLPGGIGSYILELVSDAMLGIPVKRLGLDLKDMYYTNFTDREYIRQAQRLDDKSIENTIYEFVG